MNKSIFFVTFLLAVFFVSFVSGLPSACNSLWDVETIDSVPWNISGNRAIHSDSIGFPSFSQCSVYEMKTNASVSFSFSPKYSDSWVISLYDSKGNELCKKSSSGSSIQCLASIDTKRNLYVVITANNLSNNGSPANGFNFSLKFKEKDQPSNSSNNSSSNCVEGYKCKKNPADSTDPNYEYLMLQYTNCEWNSQDTVYCQYGCSNNKCNPDQQTPEPTSTCSAGWKCYNSEIEGYQEKDCSWSSKNTCSGNCSNNKCEKEVTATLKPQPTCSVGWQCNDSTHESYVNADCSRSKVSYCSLGCGANNRCNVKYVAPTIKVLYKSPEVDSGFLATYSWQVFGTYEETGIEYGSVLKYSTMIKKSFEKNSKNQYLAVLSPAKNTYALFVRAYAVSNGKTIYSPSWKIVVQPIKVKNVLTDSIEKYQQEIKKTLISNTDFAYSVDEINFSGLIHGGADTIKFFTIQNCLDNGIWDVWCALDIASDAAIVGAVVFPADGPVLDAIAIETKLGTLAKSGKILSLIKNGEQFGNYISKVTLVYKDKKFVKTGLDFANLLDNGIVKIVGSKLTVSKPSLLRYAMEKGDYSIMRLLSEGNQINTLEKITTGGADLGIVVFATENKYTLAWLERASQTIGADYIINSGRANEIKKALNFSKTTEVWDLMKKIIENPENKNIIKGNSIEFINQIWVKGVPKKVKVVVDATAQNGGKIRDILLVK